jgi:hypothetical protein
MKSIHKIAAAAMTILVLLLAPAIGFSADSGMVTDVTQTSSMEPVDPGEEIGKAIGDALGSMDMGHAILVPIMGIVGALIMPMLMIIIVCFLAFRHRERKQQRNHETIRLMIEKGVQIPPNLSFGEAPETGSPLKRGLKFIGIGAGLIVFFIVLGSTELAGIGAIPLFIGLAYLLSWRLEKGQTGSEPGKAG